MSETNDASGPGSGAVNWPAALEASGGDEALLADLVEMFANTEAPSLLENIGESIAELHPDNLQRSAHTLKGSLRIFESTEASELSLQLELLGKRLLRYIAIDRLHAGGEADPQGMDAGKLEKLGREQYRELDSEDRQRLLQEEMQRAREIEADLKKALPPVLDEMRDFLDRRAT